MIITVKIVKIRKYETVVKNLTILNRYNNIPKQLKLVAHLSTLLMIFIQNIHFIYFYDYLSFHDIMTRS